MRLDPREHFDLEEIHGERVTWHDCACCYEARHVSEFTDPNDDTVVEALTAKHGGPVCDFCADEYYHCRECDGVTAESNPDLLCEDCAAETPQARADARADERAAIFMETRQ